MSKRQPADPDPPAVLRHLQQAAAAELWRLGAVRVSLAEPFRLASGQVSPLYVNGRQAIGDPGFVRLFTAAAGALLNAHQVDFEVLVGGETAGIPYAAFLAVGLARPLAYVRKRAKGHGIAGRTEGAALNGRRVLLVEDLITDGGSKLAFLEAIAEVGGTVRDALVLIDREQGGGAQLAARGVTLHAVTNLTAILDVGLALGGLQPGARATIDRYLRDPEGWQEEPSPLPAASIPLQPRARGAES